MRCKYCKETAKFRFNDEELCYNCFVKQAIKEGFLQRFEEYYYFGEACVGDGSKPFNFDEAVSLYSNLEYVDEPNKYGVFEIERL